MLTLEQVHANNAVAKEFLKAGIDILKEYDKVTSERKKFYESLSVMGKILHFFANGTNHHHAEIIAMTVKYDLVMNLALYFKYHYKTAGLMSAHSSPEIKITSSTDNVLWTTVKTFNLTKVPFPARM